MALFIPGQFGRPFHVPGRATQSPAAPCYSPYVSAFSLDEFPANSNLRPRRDRTSRINLVHEQ